MSLTISYKGVDIVDETADCTKTLKTAGKYCEADIEVEYSGGGETRPSELNLDKVSFVDYDGVLVADYTLAEIQQMTSDDELPTPPPHDRITFVGWNWTLAQLKAENRPIIVGAIQKATANALELDIVTYDGGLDIGLSLGLDGTATVEWGDNQSESVTHSGNYATSIELTHSYSEAGDYTIVVTPTSGTLGGKYDQYPAIFDTTKGLAANDFAAQIRHLRGVRIGDFTIRYNNDFYRTFAYAQIHSIAQNGAVCDLRDAEIVFANHSAMDCRDLVSCSLPPNTTQIAGYAFSGDFSLGYVTMPSTVTSILSDAFGDCYGLQYIRIPNSVTDFKGRAFPTCRGVRTYDFREWSIADLQACTFGVNIFQNITANTQLLFATKAIADEAKVTTNLATYASYITYEGA